MKSGSDLVGFHRVPSNSDEIRAGFRPIGIRQKPCRIRHILFRSDRIRPPMNLLGISVVVLVAVTSIIFTASVEYLHHRQFHRQTVCTACCRQQLVII
jgi:hypothetical protein